MTGTADTEAYEFQEIYGLETVVIPPNRISRREDQQDRVYKTTREKYDAALVDIRECYERGQPVLVGTTSIENSEIIATLLEQDKLPHQVLNAKQHAREADIIAQAGRLKMITIATNMAGRGTDIVLGGNTEKAIAEVESHESLSAADKEAKILQLRTDWQREHDAVKALGGLRIIATERHESRRIDNQLRGRSGRQGDPGSSRFYLSLDDSLMRIFAGDRVKAIMERLKMPDGEAIEAGMVSRSIESAQRKVEARNFDMRKQLLEYDDVSNDQRKVIYQQRNAILDAVNLNAQIESLRQGCFHDLTRQYLPEQSVEEQWDIQGLEKVLAEEWRVQVDLQTKVAQASAITDEEILESVLQAANQAFQDKITQIGEANFTHFERMVLLQSIDTHWRDHLSALDYLRQGIHLRGYAQKQPKQEYKREAFELFGQLLDSVKNESTKILMTVNIQSNTELDEASQEMEHRGEALINVTYSAPTETGEVQTTPAPRAQGAYSLGNEVAKVGRNEPCPCGSGKKYKHCHGALS
jgi:preprotein translocase subunit SecA